MLDYANPEVLVNTEWVAEHLDDSNVRLLEVGWDTSEFESGHIPGAVAAWAYTDLHREDEREIPSSGFLRVVPEVRPEIVTRNFYDHSFSNRHCHFPFHRY